MIQYIKRIADNEFLQSCILFLILVNAIILGMMTYPNIFNIYGDYMELILLMSQIIFTIEIIIRLLAYTPEHKRFFSDFSNTFDFSIVILSMIPMIGSFAYVARVLRIFRTLRILSISDGLRTYIAHIKSGISGIFSSLLIYIVLLYVFAITGFYLFSGTSPDWLSLQSSISQVFIYSIFSDTGSIAKLLSNNFASILYFISLYMSFGILYIHTAAYIFSKYSYKK